MTHQSHKKLVTNFFSKFVASDIEGVFSLLEDEVSWRMMGQQGGLPVSGELDKAGVADLMKSVRELVVDRLNMTIGDWTIEGSRVAV